MNLQPDQLICRDKYRLIRFLGKGGYGEVWLAEERASRSQKAIKIAHQNAEAWQRFNRELQLSSQLDHANLVVTHTVEPDGDTSFMVMPYMAGGSLAEKLKQGPLPLLEAVQIAAQIAAGLGHLHRKDWVHRDVHPGNILFNGEGVARLSDFGLVQTPHTSVSLWYGGQTERHPGNVYYQPPEAIGQAGRPLAPLYASSDVYMLGAVLWEMVTGKSYYHHKNKPLHQLRTDAPDWLAKLLTQCLSPVVGNRPFDGATLAQLLTMGAAQLAKTDGQQSAQARQRQQAQVQQTLVQKAKTAIEKRDWQLAKKSIAELQAQGTHTQLAVSLLQEQLQTQSIKQLAGKVEQSLTSDPTVSMTYIAELEKRFPHYSELPKLKQVVENRVVEQVTGIRPLRPFSAYTWGLLLCWLLLTPQAYQRYRDTYGQESLARHMAWLVSGLIHWPLLLWWLWAIAHPLLLEAEGLSSPYVGWVFLAIGVSWLLTGWAGHYKEDNNFAIFVAPIVAAYVATVVALGVAVVVAGGVASGVTVVVVGIVAFSVAVVVAGFSTGFAAVLVAVGVTVVVAVGVAGFSTGFAAGVAAGVVAGVVAGGVVGGVTVGLVINETIENGRFLQWAFWLLMAAYGVLGWQVVAAWLS